MFTLRRQIGLEGADDIARVRRLTADVMDAISLERKWSDAFEKVAVYSAVDQCLTTLIGAGEPSDDVLTASALKIARRTERQRQAV